VEGVNVSNISGVLKVGEAQAAMRAIATRQRGPALVYYGLLCGLMILGGLGGAAVDILLNPPDAHMGFAIGLMVGSVLYVLFCRRITLSRFRKRLSARGISLDLPLNMEVTPNALAYTVGDVQQRAKWNAVTELFQSHGYWIFLVQSSPWFAPKHFFADAPAERSFVEAALARMGEEAKRRSSDAVNFIEG
jgi:hypothetical protein